MDDNDEDGEYKGEQDDEFWKEGREYEDREEEHA